jgi:ferredoxin
MITVLTQGLSSTAQLSKGRFEEHLQTARFFKVILGASFTDVEQVSHFTRAYAQSGLSCFDLAADHKVIAAVNAVLDEMSLPVEPVLMVSLPLDPDPHFRKIELDDPACIRCSACVPICPAEALTLPGADLEVSQTLCYGCGRCVPVCPTEALSMLPFQTDSTIVDVLQAQRVSALEIHSHAIDPLMLEAFFLQWAEQLENKIVSLCFRPSDHPAERILEFAKVALRYAKTGLLFQSDGKPMSGSSDPAASLPAIEGADKLKTILLEEPGLADIPITISGGINKYTAELLSRPENAFIRGVGMGTMARTLIAHDSSNTAAQRAEELVQSFQF